MVLTHSHPIWPPTTTHYRYTFHQDFHRWMGLLSTYSLLHINCRFSWTVHHHTQHFPVTLYEVATSESGSYLIMVFSWLLQWECYYNTGLICKGNGQVLEVKDCKCSMDTCSQLNYPLILASLTKFVSMAMFPWKLEDGWVVENIKHFMTCLKGNS